MDQSLRPGYCYAGLRLNYAICTPVCCRLVSVHKYWLPLSLDGLYFPTSLTLGLAIICSCYWISKYQCSMPKCDIVVQHYSWLYWSHFVPSLRARVWFTMLSFPSTTTPGNIPKRGFTVSLGSRKKRNWVEPQPTHNVGVAWTTLLQL